jgi:hypothetical protein
MKKVVLFITALWSLQIVAAQNPPAPAGQAVTWEFKAKKIDSEHYELSLTAVIQGKWHIYSQFTPEGGPVPTQIVFSKNPLIVLNGAAKEVGKLHEKYEEVFGINVKYYDGLVVFKQLITLKKKVKTKISGTVEYMVCDDTQCLPPKKEAFTISF